MSTLKVAGNPAGGGDVTLQGPASTVTRTLTLPDVTGTLAALETVVGGAGQAWQLLTGSRAYGTTYTNNTGRPILVKVYIAQTVANAITAATGRVNGVDIDSIQAAGSGAGGVNFMINLFVPTGATYGVFILNNAGGSFLGHWAELR